VKNLVSWDMTSHPKSLEYAVMVLWCIVCDVATLVCVCVCVCLVKAYMIQAYASASRGHRSHYTQSLIIFFLEKLALPDSHEP